MHDPVSILPIQLRNGITGDVYGVELWGKYGLMDWWRLNFGFSGCGACGTENGTRRYRPGQAIGRDPSYQAQLRRR